jgi:S-adenosylmethionine uptake transporter
MGLRAALTNKSNMVLLGILLMLLGDFMFALNDAMGKWLVASISVGQVVLIRSIGAFIVLGPMIAKGGAKRLFALERPWLQALRVVAATLDTLLFYAAVVHLPLADVMSYYMAAPIYVAALSHFLLGEKVGWRRWTAIVLGFVGVLIMLKPGTSALSASAIYAVIGSLSFAFTILLARLLRGTSDTALVTWQTVGALVVSGVMAFGTWTTPTALDLGAMLLLGVVSCIAHLLITRALKLAPASTLAPFNYTLLLWSVVMGYVFFSDVPGTRMLAGAAIVVLAGLFIFHRQNVKAEVIPEDVPRGIN